MHNVTENLSIYRFALEWTRALGAWHRQFVAGGATLWLLVLLTIVGPLHLAQEVHASLPASARHHVTTHCETGRELACQKPNDDVSQPLSGQEHQRHHQASCSQDSQFAIANADVWSATPQAWDTGTLDYALPAPAPRLQVPASPRQSRAPPEREMALLSISLSPQSGRAPPITS